MTSSDWVMPLFDCGSCLAFGFLLGWLIHKRKRDKQMARLVAERLLGKSNPVSNDMQSTTNAQANVVGQQINSMGISNNLSSMLGNDASGGIVYGSNMGQRKVL